MTNVAAFGRVLLPLLLLPPPPLLLLLLLLLLGGGGGTPTRSRFTLIAAACGMGTGHTL